MASVKRFKDSRHWYACFKIPTGRTNRRGLPEFKHVQRTTGLEDRQAALQVAISLERAAVAAASNQWTQAAARRLMTELNALAGTDAGLVEPTDQFLQRWMRGRTRTLSASSYTRYEGIIKDFIAFLKTMAGGPISDITHGIVSRYRNAQLEAGKNPNTVNKNLMVLAQPFAEAKQSKVIEVNPFEGQAIKGAKRAKQMRSPFSFDQFRELVRTTDPTYKLADRATYKDYTLHPDWQTLVIALAYTGGRQQEVAKLRWEQINFEQRLLWLVRTKNNDEHWIPIHRSLAAHLEQTPATKRHGYVMPYLSGLQRRRISNAFRVQILPRIGVVQAYASGSDAGRKLAKFSIHSFRHSLATWLRDAGVEESIRMKVIGHENEEVNRQYTHTELNQIEQELSKVPQL